MFADHLEPIDITDPCGWDPYGTENNPSWNSHQISGMQTDAHPLDDLLLYHPSRSISALQVTKPRHSITPSYLSSLWGIGLGKATKTIEATSCKYFRQIEQGISRRFRTRRNLLRHRQLALPAGEFYSDTLFSLVKSVRGYTCAQIYGNKYGFIKAYPMESKGQQNIGDTLTLIVQDVGVPQSIHTDNAPEMVGKSTPFFKRARKEGIDLTTIEPGRPDENYGEVLVRTAKATCAKLMHNRNVPLRLWCFALEYATELASIMVPGMYRNKGRTGYEVTLGFTPDISEYVEFAFYDYCWYWESPQSFPHDKKKLGRWLGIAHRVGQAMVFYVMSVSGKVIARSTVAPLDPSDHSVKEVMERMQDLDSSIKESLGDYRNALVSSASGKPQFDDSDIVSQLEYCFQVEKGIFDSSNEAYYSDNDRPDIDDAPNMEVESSEFDKFLGLHVELPSSDGGGKVIGRVVSRKRDSDGRPIGKTHDNPIINTAIYNIKTPDGNIAEYSANTIAENLWAQVDNQGFNFDYIHDIIGHRKDDTAVSKKDGFITTASGTRRRVITTKGWQLQVQWENGETSWIALKDIKESNPVETAEYAVNKNIDDEPAFAWWVQSALKRRDVQVSAASRRFKKNMKFGIEIPKTYEEAVALDRANGNTLWQDATRKEMANVEVAFKFLDDGSNVPIGFKEITCHLIFDIKFTLDRKARYVAGGHLTNVPASMTYSSVVSRDSVRIMLLIAALNDLDIKMCDIGNAYLNAETRERVWFRAGREWGERNGTPVVIVRALYGLKSSGAEWKKTFASYIKHTLGFTSCIGADDDVYMRLEKDELGNEFYSYILCYVDDVLVLHKDPDKYLNMVNRDFRLKNPPEAPTMYLGADISKYEIPASIDNQELSRTAWAMSADSHIKKALQMVEERLAKEGFGFKTSKKVSQQPFSTQAYRPELDVSEYCNDDQTQFYQSLIGVLRWLTEIGRIDILTETSMLSSYLAMPRTGHLQQAIHIFKYLKDHNRSKMVFDPQPVYIHDDDLPPEERAAYRAKFMAELYPEAIEYKPGNAPPPKGNSVSLTCFVDSDHAGDRMTRRSRTGIIIFVNRAPVMWFSKRQNTVETSTYGAEFVAMKQALEMIKSLKYKLQMFGIPIVENGVKVLGDNRSVILNCSVPESTLKKKHHSVNFHFVRECVAAGVALVMKVDTGCNLADLFTKILDKETRKNLVKRILW